MYLSQTYILNKRYFFHLWAYIGEDETKFIAIDIAV